ncbi:ABC transporter permease [Cytophagales bacterium WSM2-2]|nr:ABC transporter permease [Cytophagales bacterium WSM2-2]
MTPPKLPLRFFRWFCHPELRDSIEGDLMELYRERAKTKGKKSADINLAIDVLLLFRPGIIGFVKKDYSLNYVMIQNNFKIAFRNLWKNKVSSSINILGLTTGIASCLFILLFIQNELSFDRFQENGSRIARVIMEYSFDGGSEVTKGNFTSTKVAPVFSRTFPEVEKAIRMTDVEMIVKHNDNLITEKSFLFADSSFFDAFHYELISGNISRALNGPNKVVLTESTAHRYFDNESPIGKILLMGPDARPYEVTAVIKDYPENSQIRFDMVGSFSSMHENQESTYFDANYTTYLLLRNEASIGSLQQKLHPFMEQESKGDGAKIRFYLEKFDQIHLHSEYGGFTPNTSITYLYILAAIALLILVIVCITYVNLSTAKSVDRAREVGIRKVSGAVKSQLFWQFIGESFVVCCLSVLVSFAATASLLPYFNLLVEKQLQLQNLLTAPFLLISFSIVLMVSLFAGGYPAIVLSRLQPAKVLKGVFRNTSSGKWVQPSLIVFQFSISVFLIIATFIIHDQLEFIQSQKLGYDRNHLLRLRISWDTPYEKAESIKQQLQVAPGVIAVSRCASSPVRISSGFMMSKSETKDAEQISVTANPIDQSYIQVTGLEFIAGSNITDQDMTDAAVPNWEEQTYHFILSESAAHRLGWTPAEAIGQRLKLKRKGVVSGVVKDFHFQSLHESIKPIVLFSAASGGTLLLKIEGGDIQGSLAQLESRWKKIVPDRPFEYQFINDDYNRMYRSEQQLGEVMKLFAGIAIVLASLGLFGLSSYMIQQRTKEIGIRKILGASPVNLLSLLSRGFIRLVLLAIIVASPIAYLLMSQWLNSFAYRIGLSWWVFLVAGSITIVIAILTVSVQGMKTSIANPVKSLRSE